MYIYIYISSSSMIPYIDQKLGIIRFPKFIDYVSSRYAYLCENSNRHSRNQ